MVSRSIQSICIYKQVYSEKITRIVEDISGLNLLEVNDLPSSKAHNFPNCDKTRLQTWTVCWSQSWTFPTLQSWWLELLLPPLRQLLLLRCADCSSSLLILFSPCCVPSLFLLHAIIGPLSFSCWMSHQEEEEAAPQVIQTSFTVKLNKFDAAKKVVDIIWPNLMQIIIVWPGGHYKRDQELGGGDELSTGMMSYETGDLINENLCKLLLPRV